MASWGNQAGNQNNQHMESPNGYHLKVTDANENGPALYAKNSNAGGSARALVLDGKAQIPTIVGGTWMEDGVSVVRDVNDVPALDAVNRTTNASSRAFRTHGAAELVAYAGAAGDANVNALTVTNASTHANARALVVTGKSEIPTIVGNVNITGDLDVDDDVNIDGDIVVDQTSTLSGAVTLGNTLAVTGATTLSSTLAVGPAAAGASINAGGNPNAQNLAIGGGGGTANVQLGRANQTVDLNCQERLNGNAVVLNGAANLAPGNGGTGFVFNAVGWGGGPSIDFYINGVFVRYVDAGGWL